MISEKPMTVDAAKCQEIIDFRRWHRDKRNSGGLLVHKATHHFDLVNFWLGTYPKTVFAFGDLSYIDGAMSILTGISANKSISTGLPVNVLDLVEIPGYRR